MQISKYYTLQDLTKSNAAIRLGYTEQFNPPQEIIDNMILLGENILDPLTDYFGGKLSITSCYRSPRINESIGGSKTSEHMFGKAVDLQYFEDKKENNILIVKAILDLGLDFNQMINEFNYSWIHVSFSKDSNKKQMLEAYKDSNGKTLYKNYIFDSSLIISKI